MVTSATSSRLSSARTGAQGGSRSNPWHKRATGEVEEAVNIPLCTQRETCMQGLIPLKLLR